MSCAAHTVDAEKDDQQQSGQQPGQEHALDADVGDDAIDQDSKAGREQQAERTRGGEQAQAEVLRVAFIF